MTRVRPPRRRKSNIKKTKPVKDEKHNRSQEEELRLGDIHLYPLDRHCHITPLERGEVWGEILRAPLTLSYLCQQHILIQYFLLL